MTTYPAPGTKSKHNNAYDLYPRSGKALTAADGLEWPEMKSMPVLANSGHSPVPGDIPPTEWKSIYREAFTHYLRMGGLMTVGEGLAMYERKFNPYHDKRGRYTFAPGGSKAKGRGRKTRPMSKQGIQKHAAHAMEQYKRERARGKSPAEAAAWTANSEAESHGNPSRHQDGGGLGRGLFQWGNTKPAYDRRITFRQVMGIPVDQATADQQLSFRDWELAHTYKSAQKHIDAAQIVEDKWRCYA